MNETAAAASHRQRRGNNMGEQRATRPLNYDPSDPDKMRLTAGTTCGDCVHIARCKAIFGHVEADIYCDWSPSRFHARAKEAKP